MGKRCHIGVDAAKLAGLQIDMLQKLRNGQMTIEQLEWFNHLSQEEREQCMFQVGGPKVFPVTVDYTKSLSDMIEAGNYNRVNENITADNFPMEDKGEHEVKLEYYRFDATVTGEEALKLMDEAGFRPATLPELLAFGAAHPEEQRKFPIVALGSSWRSPGGYLHVPYLCEDARERDLHLCWLEHGFVPHDRFLVVRK